VVFWRDRGNSLIGLGKSEEYFFFKIICCYMLSYNVPLIPEFIFFKSISLLIGICMGTVSRLFTYWH
jgi:hypothetical protein